MATRKRPLERWESLLESNNLSSDLAEIYTHDFFDRFSSHFDPETLPHKLFDGVLATANAYLTGKQEYKIHFDTLKTHSGIHLRRAGIAARNLQYSLGQLSKSSLVTAKIRDNMFEHLAIQPGRGFGAHRWADTQNGPSAPLTYIQELAEALSRAINDIYPLPDADDEGEGHATKNEAHRFVDSYNIERASHSEKLPVHYALERAASVFRPTWEQHSTLSFTRGRYKHELGGYDSESSRALHRIISEIDPQIPESLVGTAIENIRKIV